MPTGYTAKLMDEGESFENFVLRCAHAFGALIELRDEPSDAPIPEFKPSPYYTESLAKHTEELARLRAMTAEQQILFGENKKQEVLKQHREWLAKDQAANVRLNDMGSKVIAWQPPSADHQELKRFMLQQINVSKNSLTYIQQEIAKAEQNTAIQFFADALMGEIRGVEYASEEMEKEKSRAESRNEWVRKLKSSLEPVAA